MRNNDSTFSTAPRSLWRGAKASLLLKEGGVDAVFGAVGDFSRPKAEHQRRAVPHRLDMLLHGMPGSGKTSVITAAASHRVAILPSASEPADDTLAKGLTRASQPDGRPVALEDADRLFEHTASPVTAPKRGSRSRSRSAASTIRPLTTNRPLTTIRASLRFDHHSPFEQFSHPKGVLGACVTLASLPIRRKRLPSVRVCCAHTHTQAGRDARTRHLDGRGQRGEGSQRAPEGAWVHGRYAARVMAL